MDKKNTTINSTAMKSTEVRLASRPSGFPTPENFSLAQVDVAAPADGQVLVRNLFISVDPYMRGRMNDVKSYVPPFRLGEPLQGGAVGEVIESRDPNLKPGDLVTSMLAGAKRSSRTRMNCDRSTPG